MRTPVPPLPPSVAGHTLKQILTEPPLAISRTIRRTVNFSFARNSVALDQGRACLYIWGLVTNVAFRFTLGWHTSSLSVGCRNKPGVERPLFHIHSSPQRKRPRRRFRSSTLATKMCPPLSLPVSGPRNRRNINRCAPPQKKREIQRTLGTQALVRITRIIGGLGHTCRSRI